MTSVSAVSYLMSSIDLDLKLLYDSRVANTYDGPWPEAVECFCQINGLSCYFVGTDTCYFTLTTTPTNWDMLLVNLLPAILHIQLHGSLHIG